MVPNIPLKTTSNPLENTTSPLLETTPSGWHEDSFSLQQPQPIIDHHLFLPIDGLFSPSKGLDTLKRSAFKL